MSSPYTTFGLPADPVAWGALGLALLALAAAVLRPSALASRIARLETRTVVGALALSATLLSFGYVAHYLRGGPRIIDASSYLLEARMLAEGAFSFGVPEPSGSFRGRFLLTTPSGELTVIFPPGYPAALALGVLAGAPLAVGPILAGALVVATYDLTRRLSGDEDVARLAALLSAACAALRYHTADTMSHGLAALLLAVGLAMAARSSAVAALGSGLSIGWLIATRPLTGAVGAVLALYLVGREPRRLLGFALATIPGLSLLAAHQYTATGSVLGSTQLGYYALADGPPGCFRYGLGQGIGCLFEHGDFVRARLGTGYGLVEASANTLRRLAVHSVDVANAFPLALVLVYGAIVAARRHGLGVLAVGALALIVAYAPFYFDGSYPGGGARLFAEALPLEHGLLACGLIRLKGARFALPVALLGFALHQSHAHLTLRDREGGRPMFEPSVLSHAGVTRGLVFVGTDHGFNLGHLPGRQDARSGIVVARLRGDAHDRRLWERLGRPPAYRYDYDPTARAASPAVVPLVPPETERYEAEAQWPPLAVTGWSHPDHSPCASARRGLRLRPTSDKASATVEIQAVQPGRYELHLGWSALNQRPPDLSAMVEQASKSAVPLGRTGGPCGTSSAGPFRLSDQPTRLVLETTSGAFVDYLELVRVP